ncbi:hypothetical protein RCL1_004173 [Eukaryota sp. TZLM3-RCL]
MSTCEIQRPCQDSLTISGPSQFYMLPADAVMLGNGRGGAVYQTFDFSLKRFVAVKVLPRSHGKHEITMLGHRFPNCVPILGLKSDTHNHYLKMELMVPLEKEIGPFSEACDCLPLPDEACKRLFVDLLRGLRALHSQSRVHGDLKSANVLCNNGRFYLADFGHSRKFSSRNDVLKCPESGVASPIYRSPDSVRAQREGGYFNPFALDYWSLGILIFQATTGYYPILPKKLDVNILFDMIIATDKIDLSDVRNDEIRNILSLLLETDPEMRVKNFKILCSIYLFE